MRKRSTSIQFKGKMAQAVFDALTKPIHTRCPAPRCRHSVMEGCFREDCPATIECKPRATDPTGAPTDG